MSFANAVLGEYQDRRHLTKIDCSKTIWILATNALDTIIQDFCKVHHKPIFEDDDPVEKNRLMKHLSKDLKEGFLSQFDVSVPTNFINCVNDLARKSFDSQDSLLSRVVSRTSSHFFPSRLGNKL